MKEFNINNFHYLSPNSERKNIKLGLLKVKRAVEILNYPCTNIPAIQIVGTNGKGSITAFIENILCSEGIKIGVTTSPHLFDITERIKVNQKEIPSQVLENLLSDIQTRLNDLQ